MRIRYKGRVALARTQQLGIRGGVRGRWGVGSLRKGGGPRDWPRFPFGSAPAPGAYPERHVAERQWDAED
jgi:hypothetical protein